MTVFIGAGITHYAERTKSPKVQGSLLVTDLVCMITLLVVGILGFSSVIGLSTAGSFACFGAGIVLLTPYLITLVLYMTKKNEKTD